MALARLAPTLLDRLKRHLNSWGATVRYATVFGSAATGRMTPDSDIDLLLVRASTDHDDDTWDARVTELARLITAWTGNDGRIIEYTEDEFHAAAAAAEPLLRDIAEQGLTIAGTRPARPRIKHPAS